MKYGEYVLKYKFFALQFLITLSAFTMDSPPELEPSWEALMEGIFKEISQEESINHFLAWKKANTSKVSDKAFEHSRALAQSGKADFMEYCAKLLWEKAIELEASCNTSGRPKKDARKERTLSINKQKAFLKESRQWAWLAYLKRFQDNQLEKQVTFLSSFVLVWGFSPRLQEHLFFIKDLKNIVELEKKIVEPEERLFSHIRSIVYPKNWINCIEDKFIMANFKWFIPQLVMEKQEQFLVSYINEGKQHFRPYVLEHFEEIALLLKSSDNTTYNTELAYRRGLFGKTMNDEQREAKREELLLQCPNVPEANYFLARIYLPRALQDPSLWGKKIEELCLKSQIVPQSKSLLAEVYFFSLVESEDAVDQKVEELCLESLSEHPSKKLLSFLYGSGRAGKNLKEEERTQKEEELLLQCLPDLNAVFNLAILFTCETPGLTTNKEEQKSIIKQCLGSGQPYFVDTLRKTQALQRLKKLEKPKRGIYEELLIEIHQSEISSGQLSSIPIMLAEAIEDEKIFETIPSALPEVLSAPIAENATLNSLKAQPKKELTTDNRIKKLNKKRLKTLRDLQNIANEQQKLNAKISSFGQEKKERSIEFASNKAREEYETMLKDQSRGKKLDEIIKDILFYGHRIQGVGKPEILKNGNYQGCWSRRINGQDRIIYVVENEKIIIFESEGHYQLN